MKFKNEIELIQFIQSLVPTLKSGVGIGDDAAIVATKGKKIVATTDCLVENVHFKSEWVTPFFLGRKAAVSNLSDLAAMGAEPLFALVSLILPEQLRSKMFIKNLYRGFQFEFQKTDTSIIGGNIANGNELSITLTLIGEVQNPLLRSSAQNGDFIYCTGHLGSAAREVELLYKGKKKRMKYLSNQNILFAKIVALKNIVNSCIDISDGLALDLHRMCIASRVGAIIYSSQIPRSKGIRIEQALFGGEDYELLFTVSAKNVSKLLTITKSTQTQITQIGEIKSKSFGIQIQTNGVLQKLAAKGWDHVSI